MSMSGFLFIGVMPVGQLALGVLGSLLGIHTALFIGGAVALTAAVYAGVRVPAIANWRVPTRPHLEAGEPVLSPSSGAATLR